MYVLTDLPGCHRAGIGGRGDGCSPLDTAECWRWQGGVAGCTGIRRERESRARVEGTRYRTGLFWISPEVVSLPHLLERGKTPFCFSLPPSLHSSLPPSLKGHFNVYTLYLNIYPWTINWKLDTWHCSCTIVHAVAIHVHVATYMYIQKQGVCTVTLNINLQVYVHVHIMHTPR